MDIIKSPQKNIKAYLTNEVNIEIFEEYQNNNGNNSNEVLDFFNFLYSEFAFFDSNVENYLNIKKHFDYSLHNPKIDFLTMGTTQKEESFQNYFALSKLINHYYPVNLRDGIISSSCKYIESIYIMLNHNVGNDIMSNLLQELNSLDYEEKIEELLKMKYLSLQDENWFKDIRGVTLASKCDLEIERLGKLNLIKKPDTNPEIDLSDANAVQKIIFLNELGVIDFLRAKQPFSTSVNSLATVLTAVTGEKLNTIQPYLNALLSKTGAENNNPYKTISTVEKVKNQLINLGFKLK